MKCKTIVKLAVLILVIVATVMGGCKNETQHVPIDEIATKTSSFGQTSYETQSPNASALPDKDFVFDELNPDYREAMRQWVITISKIARERDSNFIIIPQNCSALLTVNGEIDGQLCLDFIKAIDGLGQESTSFGYGGYNKKRRDKNR